MTTFVAVKKAGQLVMAADALARFGIVANDSRIYDSYSYREIFEFREFWGTGPGRSLALGAMHAA